jgi:hypothetical protein
MYIKKIFSLFALASIIGSIVLLWFGFAENGLQIMHAADFWPIVDSLWILALLFLALENRIKE